MKKIVFTGGGTVGHVTLNLLLIPKFIEDGWEVHYIGDKHGIEHQEILKSGLDVTFHSIATGKLRRYFSWQNMLDVFQRLAGRPCLFRRAGELGVEFGCFRMLGNLDSLHLAAHDFRWL